MRGFAALVLAFVVSGLVAGAVQAQLGIMFHAREDLIIMMMILAAMTLITTFILGIALAGSNTVSGVDWTAGVLLGGTMLIIFGFAAFVAFAMAPRSRIAHDDIEIFVEIVVPFAIMMAIQWWLVRRHWIKSAAAATAGGKT